MYCWPTCEGLLTMLRCAHGASSVAYCGKRAGGRRMSVHSGPRRDLRPSKEDITFARQIYQCYKAKPGSDHIASCDALTYLSACLREFCPRTVLECGAGIGTITDALLSHTCRVDRVIATEHNAFCLNALGINLRHHDPARLDVIAPDKLPSLAADIDMIIGDGSRGRHDVYRKARRGTIIFVEGNRSTFRTELYGSLSDQGLTVHFDQFGPGDHHSLLYRLGQHLPAPLRPAKRKGCWVGRVTVSGPSSWSPATTAH